ncbi:flagellar basal body-associated protein FliL [Haloimpatiens sp. FM7330]|uniref:flagellar basal body-associated FliL family protein n=1 Tax=Haloimpatiens sp. FM7330 TaxID=3298610 RepID=UPI003639B226
MSGDKTKKKSGILKIVILVVVVALIAGGCVFAGFWFASRNNSSSSAINTKGSVREVVQDKNSYQLGDFLVNLCDDDSRRYLKVDIYLGYPKSNKKLGEELETKKPIISDIVNLHLRSKKSSEVNNTKNIQALKKQLIDKINTQLVDGQITDVYFNKILIQ